MLCVKWLNSIGGNLFSALCNPSKALSVGASTSILGLVATLIALVVVNWRALDTQPEVRCYLIIVIVFLLLFSVLFSLSSGSTGPFAGSLTTDFFAHLGGLLIGFFFACYIMVQFRGVEARHRGSYESKAKLLGLIGTAFQFILYFTLFFALKLF